MFLSISVVSLFADGTDEAQSLCNWESVCPIKCKAFNRPALAGGGGANIFFTRARTRCRRPWVGVVFLWLAQRHGLLKWLWCVEVVMSVTKCQFYIPFCRRCVLYPFCIRRRVLQIWILVVKQRTCIFFFFANYFETAELRKETNVVFDSHCFPKPWGTRFSCLRRWCRRSWPSSSVFAVPGFCHSYCGWLLLRLAEGL